MKFDKVVRDGKVAVLYSPGFGAGWSTWDNEKDFLMFDSKLVEFAESGAPEEDVEIYLRSVNKSAYTGGWDDIKIKWISQGSRFKIDEYDGSESIVFADDKDIWTTA